MCQTIALFNHKKGEEEAARLAASRLTDRPNSARIHLRNQPMSLSKNQAKILFQQKGFFSTDWMPNNRFVNDFYDNGDETITDRATGLMWQKGGFPNYRSLASVKQYIDSLNQSYFAGHSDWRLPTLEEGASLLNSKE